MCHFTDRANASAVEVELSKYWKLWKAKCSFLNVVVEMLNWISSFENQMEIKFHFSNYSQNNFQSINEIIISSIRPIIFCSSLLNVSNKPESNWENCIFFAIDWMFPSFCGNNKHSEDEGNWIGKFWIHNYYLLNLFIEAWMMKMGKILHCDFVEFEELS